MEALCVELKEGAEAATSSYSATGDFVQYIYLVLVAKNHHSIQSRFLVRELPFTAIFLTILIMVTEQLYWGKFLRSCFCFTWLWPLIAIMKRYAEWCSLLLKKKTNCFSGKIDMTNLMKILNIILKCCF